jgi:hypothetical protein
MRFSRLSLLIHNPALEVRLGIVAMDAIEGEARSRVRAACGAGAHWQHDRERRKL